MSQSNLTAFSISEALQHLEKLEAPADLVPSSIFSEESHGLFLSKGSVLAELTPEQVLLYPKASSLGPKRRCGRSEHWNVDVGMAAPGYFDESGNFVMQPSKKPQLRWFIKKDSGSSAGPFSQSELLKKASEGTLAGSYIKRDFDRGYVNADDILREVPNFADLKAVSNFFSKHQVIEEATLKDDFYDDVIVRNSAQRKNPRLTNFMQQNNVNVNVDYMIKNISNKKRTEALSILMQITGIGGSEAETLLNLLLEGTDKQILSDVDKDGFFISGGRKPISTKRKRE